MHRGEAQGQETRHHRSAAFLLVRLGRVLSPDGGLLPMKKFAFLSALLLVALLAVISVAPTESSGSSAAARKFIGTWRLVSYVGGAAEVAANWGQHPTGLLYYDGLGNMAGQIMPDRVRPKYAATQPTPDEAKAAITGYVAYFGKYTVDENARTVTRHRQGNINPGGIDDGVRHYEFAPGDRLILTPDVKPPTPPVHLTWERLK